MTLLRPYFVRSAWFSLISCLLILSPSGYMLEVYDRVVNSRSHLTLAMLTLLVFAISPLLGWFSVAGALLQVVIGWLNEQHTQPPLVAANRSAIAAQQYADSSLRNAQVIEAMGMLRAIHGRWIGKQREFLGLQAVASDRAGGYQALTKFLQTTTGSLLLGLGAWLLLRNALNGGAGMMIVASILGGAGAGTAGPDRDPVAHGG